MDAARGDQHKDQQPFCEGDTENREQRDVSDEQSLTDKMQRLGISSVHPIMPEKSKPGTLKIGEVLLSTNVYGVRLPKIPVFRYDVDITVHIGSRSLELTKRTRDDFVSTDRRKKCLEIFKEAERCKFFNEDTNTRNKAIYYDGQKIIYTFEKLKMPHGETSRLMLIDDQQFIETIGFNNVKIEFKVSEITENFQFTLSDFSNVSCDLTKCDSSLMQFINIATSEFAIFNSDDYQVFESGTCYFNKELSLGFTAEEAPVLQEGKKVSIGAHKSASYVEGPKGSSYINVAVSVDTAKTAFHLEQNVLDKAFAIVPDLFKSRTIKPSHVALLRKIMKGLSAETRQPGIPRRKFQITNISASDALSTFFEYEGEKISICGYYRTKYNFKMKYEKAPLLVVTMSGKKIFYPMEISYVLPGQRVRQEQQTPLQLSGMRKACIIKPSDRLNHNQLGVEGLRLLDPMNYWINGNNMSLLKQPLIVKGRMLPPPDIIYGQNKRQVLREMKWSFGQQFFHTPATVKVWAAYVLAQEGAYSMNMNELRKFIAEFTKSARYHGMNISECTDVRIIHRNIKNIDDQIAIAAKNDCEFILFFEHERSSLHNSIKLLERKYQVVTQCIKTGIALSVINQGKRLTLENIILKTNIKIGGLNYMIENSPKIAEGYSVGDGRLIIGLSMSHVCGQDSKKPAVIAYAANTSNESLQFIGDFNVQISANKIVDTLYNFMKIIVQKFLNVNRKLFEVIIYRSGVSEGQYSNVLQYEVPILRLALKDYKYPNVPITLMAVSRAHRNRLIPSRLGVNARPIEQNIQPGVVVDDRLVHPKFKEFYLNSHFALQGTAKVPRYIVIVDDRKIEMNELERMTFSLCFCHQIVTLPTSLPTPLYVANRYGERGRNLMNVYNHPDGDSESSPSETSSSANFDELNAKLTYGRTRLGDQRINA